MPTPPKRLTFAEEMELLKQQKAEAAALARQEAAQRLVQQQAQQPVNVDELLARIPVAAATPKAIAASARPTPTLGMPPTPTAPATPEEAERLRREKAMEAAFALHVGQHARPEGRGKTRSTMMFCTHCRCTTPGEDVQPGNAGIGLALGLLGLVPGAAYFLYRAMSTEKQCTHCHSDELVAMNSVQARTLCGEQHAALMEAGWAEMRQAELDHTMLRRIAIGKILVVAVVVLGASLYFLRAPNAALQASAAHEMEQKRHVREIQEKLVSDGVE